MKKNTVLHTNLIVCTIITIGFIVTSVIGYQSNTDIFKRDAEHVSTLAAEGIYYQIDKNLSEPINVSLTMANDSLLKSFLSDEGQHLEDEVYIQKLREYLYAYREKYAYDSVFLVSSLTNRYYHFDGLDRVLTSKNPENIWYYEFLKNSDEYSLNVDNDEATDNSITAFVNCKIRDRDGNTIGVIGVGLKVDSIQALLKNYDKKFGVTACLIDDQGFVQISSAQTGYERVNLFKNAGLNELKESILEKQTEQQNFWYASADSKGYAVAQYVPSLKWHLVVENDMTDMNRRFHAQLYKGVGIIICIILFVLFIITSVLKQYKTQIVKLSAAQEQEYKKLLQVTEGLYENIFELDITHNCASGESTKRYFTELGMGVDTPYDKALYTIVRQIKEEYAQGYLDTFLPDRVMACYNSGITNLNYDFLITCDGESYHWVRITGRIFYWSSDDSVRMISYRKNIDAEKEREQNLLEKSRRDSMTGLYNKGATENLMTDILSRDFNTGRIHAYIGFDIDDFKNINDKYGHAFGDMIIKEFAMEIQLQFRDSDIVGRVGGDEFAALMLDCGELTVLQEKMKRFFAKIAKKNFGQDVGECLSTSIGVALYPQQGKSYAELFEKADEALYYAKAHGKNTFHILGDTHETCTNFRLDARDIKSVLENTTDGVAKYSYTTQLKLLYHNKKLADLVGGGKGTIKLEDFDPLSYVCYKDLPMLQETIQSALSDKEPIDVCFRLKGAEDYYFPVRLRGFFVDELYQGCYPIFYAVYTDLSVLNLQEDDC